MSQRWRIERHERLDSTMARARELAEAGAPAGTVVVADYQTEGRGTRGRVWLAPPGTCLMFTLLARPEISPADLERLPRMVSDSIVEALWEACGLRAVVKEPNDVLVRGRKLCGVLCTSQVVGERVAWVLCGVGINTFMGEGELPFEGATSLVVEGVGVVSHEVLLGAVLRRLGWLVTAHG